MAVRQTDPIRVAFLILEWGTIPAQNLTPNAAFSLDLTQYLPTGFSGTITRKSSSGTLPVGLILGTDGTIDGTPTTAGTASVVFIAASGGVSVESDPVSFTVRLPFKVGLIDDKVGLIDDKVGGVQ